MNKFTYLRRAAAFATLCLFWFSICAPTTQMQTASQTNLPIPFPTKRQENREFWYRDGAEFIRRNKRLTPNVKPAKNVILFVGDGMGISTVTAARILEGQRRGESGEENSLSFEQFPNVALSKTYSANQQTSDSAPTMSAIITGVKTDEGVLSVDQTVVRGDYRTLETSRVPSLLELAEQRGLSTGVVSTARLTHATPGACYAHAVDRDWESDANQKPDAKQANSPDIARQLIEFGFGDGLEVAIGGGRSKFLPKTANDPEYPNQTGERLDNRNLADEWTRRYKDAAYVWNKQQFDAVNPKQTKHLLGLFEPSHMQYEHDRAKDAGGEPSLSEMTTKAIDVLANNKKGYFLMVEAGRIDHAHHNGNAFRALGDTIELSNAVRAALAKVDLRDTLIIVTADHSHTFVMGGYPIRGNNILGLTREVDQSGNLEPDLARDKNGLPYTTLNYANGKGNTNRPNLQAVDTAAPDYKQEAIIPLGDETHGGEDVAIFATGAGAELVRGVMEENHTFFVMAEALRLAPSNNKQK